MLSSAVLRVPTAPQFSGQARSRCCAGIIAPLPRRIATRYTSMQGRLGEEGEEEASLRDSINKLTAEKQYAGTFRVKASGSGSGSGSGHVPVNEEKEPGYHHESRKDLEKRGAVVHEEVGGREGHHPSPASAPESGTEGRTTGSGADTESARTTGSGSSRHKPATHGGSDSEDISSAPESGTVRG